MTQETQITFQGEGFELLHSRVNPEFLITTPRSWLEILNDETLTYSQSPAEYALKQFLEWRYIVICEEFHKVIKVCESPIERSMFYGLLCVATHFVEGINFVYPDGRVVTEGDNSSNQLFICPQYRINKYTADFLLVCKRNVLKRRKKIIGGRIEKISESKEFVTKAIIECDGHDYHERTREQARRDRAKDRFFQAEGHEILRFTGQEINEDPVGCGKQVFDGMDKVLKTACEK